MKQFYLLTCLCCLAFSQNLEAQVASRDSTTGCPFGPVSFTYTIDTFNFLTVHFIPSPNDTGYTYLWGFGDGSTSTLSTPSHTYASTGGYLAALVVTKAGCSDQGSQSISISGPPPPPPPPSCSVSLLAQKDSGFQYTLSAYPSNQGRDSTFTYRWLINDTLVSTRSVFAYTFPRPGFYQICVFQSSPDSSCNAEQCQNLDVAADTTVVPPPPPTCSVFFTYTIDSLNAGLVSFHAVASPAPDSTSYYWVITSDSLTRTPPITPVVLTGSNPTYTFSDTGEYTVTLRTTAPSGCTAYTAQDIRISQTGTNHLKAYPNPVTDVVHVNLVLQKTEPVYITIFSSMGNLMDKVQVGGVQGLNILSIPVKKLPPGIYFMHLQYGNSSSESRFQKL